MKAWGMPVSALTRCYDSIDAVIEHAREWELKRNTLDFQTDGLVIKVDDLDQRQRLGARSKSPRWTIAFKYEAEQAITKISHIGVQVGKTGKLTPVADLVPVAWPARPSSGPRCTTPTRSRARTSGSATPW